METMRNKPFLLYTGTLPIFDTRFIRRYANDTVMKQLAFDRAV